jgi:hypothetical protein
MASRAMTTAECLADAQANGLVTELEELGFGGGDPIDGAAAVNVINHHLHTLRRLPALAELVDAAEACRIAGGSAEFFSKYGRLMAALNKFKGA